MDDRSVRLAAQPLHLQLRRALLARITSGEWRHGDAIPNENQLARDFNLSPGTVRKALDWMEQVRLVVRQQGRGTFVTDPAAPEFAGRFDTLRGPNGKRLQTAPAGTTIENASATAEEIGILKLPSDERRVLRIRQKQLLPGGLVIMVEEAVLPLHLYSALENARLEAYDLVQASKHCHVLLGEGSERISMSPPPAHVAAALGIAANASVLVLDRVIYTVEGVPAEMRKAWCRLGENTYQAILS